jgi:pimeloyl-ACP methyl ester carboxylesterase
MEEVRQIPLTAIGPDAYGLYPDDMEASREALFDLTEFEAKAVLANSAGAQESGLARRQRRRGISVLPGSIRCPVLVVYGEKETGNTPEQNRRLALYLAGESLAMPDAGHWGIVYSEQAVSEAAPRVAGWVAREVGV